MEFYGDLRQYVEIIVTEDCNWDCPYCIYPLERPEYSTIRKIKKHLPYISEMLKKVYNPVVTLVGGEIGLLGKRELREIVTKLDMPVSISTNGLFLNRLLHEDKIIRPYIQEIMWHITKVPDQGWIRIKDYNDEEIPITKGIVGFDPLEIAMYVKNSEKITFDYVDFDFPLDAKDRLPNYKLLYEALKDCPNATRECLNRIKRKRDNPIDLENKRVMCRNMRDTVSINLASETIPICTGRSYDFIELTPENLKQCLIGTPPINHEHTYCSSCVNWCAEKDFMSIQELKRRNARRLKDV